MTSHAKWTAISLSGIIRGAYSASAMPLWTPTMLMCLASAELCLTMSISWTTLHWASCTLRELSPLRRRRCSLQHSCVSVLKQHTFESLCKKMTVSNNVFLTVYWRKTHNRSFTFTALYSATFADGHPLWVQFPSRFLLLKCYFFLATVVKCLWWELLSFCNQCYKKYDRGQLYLKSALR